MVDKTVPVVFKVVGLTDLQRANQQLKVMGGQSGQVAKATKTTARFGQVATNTSYQLQDFIVQVQGGTDASRALSQQLPQMLIGFGAWGAAIGVVAAALPALITALGGTTKSMEDLVTAADGLADISTSTDFSGWITTFNELDESARRIAISLLSVQTRLLEIDLREAAEDFVEPIQALRDAAELGVRIGDAALRKAADNLGITATAVEDILDLVDSVNGNLLGNPETMAAVAELMGTGAERAGALIEQLQDLNNLRASLEAGQNVLAEGRTAIRRGRDISEAEPEDFDDFLTELSRMGPALNDQGLHHLEDLEAGVSALDEAMLSFDKNFESAVAGIAQGTQTLGDAFDSMVQSIIADMAKLAAQWLANAAVQALFGGPVGVTANAKGNVIAGGQVQAYAKGGVVSGPTLFPMANGAGLMGEAGPEAIMPLGRNSRGELGVKASPMNVTINNMAPGVQVQTAQTDQGLVIDLVMQEVASGIRRGGNPISQAMEDTYSVGRGRGVY